MERICCIDSTLQIMVRVMGARAANDLKVLHLEYHTLDKQNCTLVTCDVTADTCTPSASAALNTRAPSKWMGRPCAACPVG